MALLQLRMSPRATVKLGGPLSKGASVLVRAQMLAQFFLVKPGSGWTGHPPHLGLA